MRDCIRDAGSAGVRGVNVLARCSRVRPEALGLLVSPVYAHGSCYATNRVLIDARWLLSGPAAPFLSTTGGSPAPRVQPPPQEILCSTNRARISEELGPKATAVTTSLAASAVGFAGRRHARPHPVICVGPDEAGAGVGVRGPRGGREDGRSPATPPVRGATYPGRGSALALERPLGVANERVAGGFPLDVALASPGELMGENRVHDPDAVPFDIVLVGGAALDDPVALDALRLHDVPFDIVLVGGAALDAPVALDSPALV